MKKNRINRINEFIDKLDDVRLSEEQKFHSIGGVSYNSNCLNTYCKNPGCAVDPNCPTNNLNCSANEFYCETNLCPTNPKCLYPNSANCTNNIAVCGY